MTVASRVAYCRTNGVSLTYEVHGASGPVVVLVPPIGAPGAFWMPFQVPALIGGGYHVVTFDSRGVPPSDVPAPPYSVGELVGDLAGLIDHLAAAPTLVVSYSLGAFVTQEFDDRAYDSRAEIADLERFAAVVATAARGRRRSRDVRRASPVGDRVRIGHRVPRERRPQFTSGRRRPATRGGRVRRSRRHDRATSGHALTARTILL